MKPRKIILCAACVVLFVITVVQIVLSKVDPVKKITVKNIDELRVERPEGRLILKKNGELWQVGDRAYEANENACLDLVNSFSELRLLEKVTKSHSPEVLAKYELDEDKVRTVTVYSKGELLKTFKVGKTSSTNSQVYMQIGDSDDIYLVAGTLQNDVSKSENDFRSKAVVSLKKDDIDSVTVSEDSENSWTMIRGEDGSSWSLKGNSVPENFAVNAESASSWFQACASLAAIEWLPDGSQIPGERLFSVEYECTLRSEESNAKNNFSVEFYNIPDTEEYFAKASNSPYVCKVAKYSVQKYQKTFEDFE